MNKHVHKLLFLAEPPRGIIDLAKLHIDRDLFREQQIGNGEPIVVIPGYHCSDDFTKMFRDFLSRLNYTVYGWDQGVNLAKIHQYQALRRSIFKIQKEHQIPIRLIGYSLGGVYARKLGIDHPDIIQSVITIGTPIYHDVETSSMRAITLFAKLAGADHQIEGFLQSIDTPPLVPTTVLYSKSDGIVHWRDAVDKTVAPNLKHVCVRGSHMGMMHNPMIWRTVRQQYHFT